MRRFLSLALSLALASTALAQNDADYTAKIREHTTEPFFLTEYVDHLPASGTIPSPLKHFGKVIGEPGLLHYVDEINGYMRSLDAASDRVLVKSMGKSEEGREMIAVFISDAANLSRLDDIARMNIQLSDPRGLVSGGYKGDGKLTGADEKAAEIMRQTLPIYYATAGMHSPESGPPEMVMELVYRLAVDESPFIQKIRKDSVVMITPVLDPDGRDRYVDTYFYRKRNPKKPPIPLLYWGHYVAHDNNRDNIGMSLALSRNLMSTWLQYRPIVLHDLHQSVPFLYVSTGTGPYNAWLDPITIDEWHIFAYNEVNEMTKRGVPGVWTHGFYDGWAPNYAFYAANGHNAIGRFYETFGSDADTRIVTVGDASRREWFRPNPAIRKLNWSLRNNINLSQSALLMGMHHLAREKDKFLSNYWIKTKRSVMKPWNEGPAAYVVSPDPTKPMLTNKLRQLMKAQGVETKVLSGDFKSKDVTYKKGSVIIAMDQPYSRMADMLLDKQYYKSDDPEPYDDTGWTLGPLFNLDVQRVSDVKILAADTVIDLQIKDGTRDTGRSGMWIVEPSADPFLAMQLMRSAQGLEVTEQEITVDKKVFKAGSILIPDAISKHPSMADFMLYARGMQMARVDKPAVKTHPLTQPRVVLIHDWQSTQNEGWLRLVLDELKVPYTYKSVHEVRDTSNLKSKYDVILFGPSSGQNSIVNGRSMLGEAIPWKPIDGLKHLGGPDSSDDIRGGAGLQGVLNLKRFLDDGGLLICMGGSMEVPIHYGLTTGVSLDRQRSAPNGSVFLTERGDKVSPVLYGYGDTLGAYSGDWFLPFRLNVSSGAGFGGFGGGGGGGGGERPSGRGDAKDADVPQGRKPYDEPKEDFKPDYTPPQPPANKVLLRFANAEKCLISGGYGDIKGIAGSPALVLCPAGKGNVLLFGINPAWRGETAGSYQLLINALANWQNLYIEEPKEEKK